MTLTSDNELYFHDDPRADRNRLSLARGAQHWPLWSRQLMALSWAQCRMLGIAHRPSTIRTADRIVVLSQGRVVDTGGYDGLLAADGPFAALVRQGLDRLK